MSQQFNFNMCQVCINCNAWIQPDVKTVICSDCQFDNEKFAEFFLFCDSLENEFGKAAINRYRSRLDASRTTTKLNYGWIPYILAILSSIILGVLSNVF